MAIQLPHCHSDSQFAKKHCKLQEINSKKGISNPEGQVSPSTSCFLWKFIKLVNHLRNHCHKEEAMGATMIRDVTVFQLVDSRGPGGIESHILHLSIWLMQTGIKNEVIFLKDHGPHPLKNSLSENGIRHSSVRSYFDLANKLRQNPCILNTHGYKAGIIGRLLGSFTKTPVISTYHSGDLGKGKVKLYSLIDRYTAFLADDVISVSTEISNTLPVNSSKIDNFVPTRSLLPERGHAIAFVGRLSSEKDPVCFAKATRDLELPCHVYGDGPLMKPLSEGFHHIKLFGHVDMNSHWKNVGLLCITSKFEGLPLVALEAMIRGIPVISFAVGGLPELITNSINGWVIKERNETSLKNAIRCWADLPQIEKAALSISAHQHIYRNYSDQKICPEIMSIYEQALHKQNSGTEITKW